MYWLAHRIVGFLDSLNDMLLKWLLQQESL